MDANTLKYRSDVETSSVPIYDSDHVRSFSWESLDVQVRDRKTKKQRPILRSCSGCVTSGQMVALMGPSGCGKTTLLNVLANRSKLPWTGQRLVDGNSIPDHHFRQISGYVEQEDALIGSLTVRETIDFSAKLSRSGLHTRARRALTESLIRSFGLDAQSDTIVGTPLRKGLSGGQKRRTSVAAQLVTSPSILFLDEPTSGLDSAASFEVMSYVSTVAKRYNMIVIASIHQPSTATFELFDKLLLLSQGRTCYFGPVNHVTPYFDQLISIPNRVNPAEFLLDLVNVDFMGVRRPIKGSEVSLDSVVHHWEQSGDIADLRQSIAASKVTTSTRIYTGKTSRRSAAILVLLHRNFIKSYRDFLAYGTRIVMYVGLAVMMGTVWLRLPYTQESIQPFINAIFFGGAFMSFMAVAYVPSIIEDLNTYKKEYANGLYGPFSFTVANFLLGLPWLLLITILFSVVTYWLGNFRPTADGFWLWVMWLYLDLLAAEGLVVLLSSIFPIFVVALAATAFANGLWMSVGGFLVPLSTLNVFWKYVFHYIDYQAYVFQAMMFNQFKKTTYDCEETGTGFYCMYNSDLLSQGKIRGTAVLAAYRYSSETHKQWEWFGIMLAIIVVYRILGYCTLLLKTLRT